MVNSSLFEKLFLTRACEIFGGNICGGGICGRDGRYLTFSRLVWLLLPSLGPSTFHKNFCQIRVYLSFWSDRGKRLAIFNIQSSRCPFSVSELMSRKNFCPKSQFFSNFNSTFAKIRQKEHLQQKTSWQTFFLRLQQL